MSTPDAPIVYEPRVHQNDYINAPGNAESIVLPNVKTPLTKDAIYNAQVTGTLQSRSPSKLTREELLGLPKDTRAGYQASLGKSKISPEELQGIPKGERNNGKYNGITFFRTLDQVPDINADGFVDLTSPLNTFLNTTSDDLVHLHGNYTHLKQHTLAIDPEAFRGSTLTTLDPSDHVFINETVRVKPKHVTFISGDPDAIAKAKQRGFNVITNPKLKMYWQRGGSPYVHHDSIIKTKNGRDIVTSRENANLYFDEIRNIVRTNFSRPKMNAYETLSIQTGLPIQTQPFTGRNFVQPYPGVRWSPSDFRHVVYDPAAPAEHRLMQNYGLEFMTDNKFYPLLKTSYSDGDRAQWLRIRFGLDKMKKNIKPLKFGGKLNNIRHK